jgi:hypothetical protein
METTRNASTRRLDPVIARDQALGVGGCALLAADARWSCHRDTREISWSRVDGRLSVLSFLEGASPAFQTRRCLPASLANESLCLCSLSRTLRCHVCSRDAINCDCAVAGIAVGWCSTLLMSYWRFQFKCAVNGEYQEPAASWRPTQLPGASSHVLSTPPHACIAPITATPHALCISPSAQPLPVTISN